MNIELGPLWIGRQPLRLNPYALILSNKYTDFHKLWNIYANNGVL